MAEVVDGVKAGESGAVTRPAWLDSAPDAFKNNEAFYQFAEPKSFYEKADSLLKAEKGMVVLPGEKATEEERKSFYTKIGKPEAADKYEIGKPADWPADVPYDEVTDKWFKDVAFKHNLTAEQAKGVFGEYLQMYRTGHTKSTADKAAAEAAAEATRKENLGKAVEALKTEWKGDEYAKNITLAERAVGKFGGAELKRYFDESGLGNHIPLVKVFALIGKALAEDTLKGGPGGGTPPAAPGMQYESMGEFKKGV